MELFPPDLLTKVNFDKDSMLTLCKKMQKLKDTSIFSTPAKDWDNFMSNKILIPGDLDFGTLQIDKKSPIYEEDFINSMTQPLTRDSRYYVFNIKVIRPLMYNYMISKLDDPLSFCYTGNVNQVYNISPGKPILIWENILERTMSTPMDWRKSGLTTISLVIYFCQKLLFKI